MRKKYNRIAATIAVMALSVGLFAGCSAEKETADTQTWESKAESTAATETAALESETAAETETAESETAAETEAATETEAAAGELPDAYAAVLEEYKTLIQEQWDIDQISDAGKCTLIASFYGNSPLQETGYYLQDLNGDGQAELLIGETDTSVVQNRIIFDAYTLTDGQAQQLFVSHERNRYYLVEEENDLFLIANEGSNGAASSGWHYYTVSDTGLQLVQAVIYDAAADEQNPWFLASDEDWDVTNDEQTDEQTAQNIIDSYTKNYAALDWTLLGTEAVSQTMAEPETPLLASDIPEYTGSPYVEINGNLPQFSETDLSTSSYEYYSELDSLGRCGVVYACIGTDLMPTEERGEIGSVKPTGWHTVKYDVVDGNYLYNRCHLIGYQLSGENANTKNLITGTRYLNIEGMQPFENETADYVKEMGNHVMYRVTPIYEGENLLADGVQIEAQSVEDDGAGILFNVFCYNVQPGVGIDYASGESWLEDTAATSDTVSASSASDTLSASDTASVSSASDTVMVWKSATGSKYHSINNCGNMNPDKATQITEEQAIQEGLGKCSKCW